MGFFQKLWATGWQRVEYELNKISDVVAKCVMNQKKEESW